jgi:hypothetical protein
MNYQKMRNALMNYQLYTFFPLPSVRPINMDGISQFCTLILIKRQKCPQLIKNKK